MKLEAMYLISGRGWVATVILGEGERYSTGDTVQLGGITWTVRGVELCRPLASGNAPFKQNVGLILRPESIDWVEEAERKKEGEKMPDPELLKQYDIGWAIARLKSGCTVRRHCWKPATWIALREPTSDGREAAKLEHADMTVPFIYIHTDDGLFFPWTCGCVDILTEDWEAV